MRTATDTKQERINLRLKRGAKRALERAASFAGKTVSFNKKLAAAFEEHDQRVTNK